MSRLSKSTNFVQDRATICVAVMESELSLQVDGRRLGLSHHLYDCHRERICPANSEDNTLYVLKRPNSEATFAILKLQPSLTLTVYK